MSLAESVANLQKQSLGLSINLDETINKLYSKSSLLFLGNNTIPINLSPVSTILNFNSQDYKSILKHANDDVSSVNFTIKSYSNTVDFNNFSFLPTPLNVKITSSTSPTKSFIYFFIFKKIENNFIFETQSYDETVLNLKLFQKEDGLFNLEVGEMLFENLQLEFNDPSYTQTLSIGISNIYSIKSSLIISYNRKFIDEFLITDTTKKFKMDSFSINGCDLISTSIFPYILSISEQNLYRDLELTKNFLPLNSASLNELQVDLLNLQNQSTFPYTIENHYAKFNVVSTNIVYNFNTLTNLLTHQGGNIGTLVVEFSYKLENRRLGFSSLNIVFIPDEITNIVSFSTPNLDEVNEILKNNIVLKEEQNVWLIFYLDYVDIFINNRKKGHVDIITNHTNYTINILPNTQNKIKIKKIKHFDRIVDNLLD